MAARETNAKLIKREKERPVGAYLSCILFGRHARHKSTNSFLECHPKFSD